MMWITKRKRLLLGLALFACLGVLALGTLVFALPRSPINPENFAKIEIGMTETEVVDIFGGPGKLGNGPNGQPIDLGFRIWSGGEWVAIIYFDKDGLVSATMFGSNPQTSFRKLRRWFGL